MNELRCALSPAAQRFLFSGGENILRPEHMAVANGRITAGVNHDEALSVRGLWSPPFCGEDFSLEIRLDGLCVKADEFCWYPYGIERSGHTGALRASSLTALCDGMRALVMRGSLAGGLPGEKVHLQMLVRGGLESIDFWGFSRQKPASPATAAAQDNMLTLTGKGCTAVLRTSLAGLRWFAPGNLWETEIILNPAGETQFWLCVSLGEPARAREEAAAVSTDWGAALAGQFAAFNRAAEDLFKKLPTFSCENVALMDFYNRSLVHYFTNHWDVPEFRLRPTYCTGGMRGGCFAAYLWDYAGGWELHPLFDPAATKAHIAHYLSIDMGSHYAFNPMDGAAFGPWYPVNQEKIIGLIRYYVLHTGDISFLHAQVNGKQVWAHAVAYATLRDDPGKPVALIDYGEEGEHHLELRRGYPYCGVMPDINARRYPSYLWAADIAQLAGYPQPWLRERAQALKALLRQELWDEEKRWFAFEHAGKRDFRWTALMYKLIDSGVLEEDQLDGLLSHLNEAEFLSPYGLHSISKLDEAYDQIDIDQGGGGSCSIFAPLIAEQLCRRGRPELAADLLRQILWWGRRVPYFGDSFVANFIEYRHDTPLQCTVGGVAGAQAILFGLFGLRVETDGSVVIRPCLPEWAGQAELHGLRIRGYVIDIRVAADGVAVTANGKRYTAPPGEDQISLRVCAR